ncbi:MAG TPA: hydroxymethylbilane synthase [Verrucomicrobiae bacterium]|nr:hydroxymethylbilane synthase [Verrucomicrobiae bacterium]
MTESIQLIAGTRASQMALFQTNKVIENLKGHHQELSIKQKHISTKGDIDQTPIPLDTIGKAWFTKEIEQELIDRHIDFAVHSLKDIPPELPPGLIIMPILKRDDPRDGLIATTSVTLKTLPKGAIIGTDSLRRKALLLRERPDLIVKSIRGNANTRLQKLESGTYDALVMAVAGLERIDRSEMITEYLDPTTFVTSIGQGTLAVELRSERQDLIELFKELQDTHTLLATAAEQEFANVIGGGCKLPVACYVRIDDDTAHIHGMVGNMDARQSVIKSLHGAATNAVGLAQQLACDLAREPFVAEYVKT